MNFEQTNFHKNMEKQPKKIYSAAEINLLPPEGQANILQKAITEELQIANKTKKEVFKSLETLLPKLAIEKQNNFIIFFERQIPKNSLFEDDLRYLQSIAIESSLETLGKIRNIMQIKTQEQKNKTLEFVTDIIKIADKNVGRLESEWTKATNQKQDFKLDEINKSKAEYEKMKRKAYDLKMAIARTSLETR